MSGRFGLIGQAVDKFLSVVLLPKGALANQCCNLKAWRTVTYIIFILVPSACLTMVACCSSSIIAISCWGSTSPTSVAALMKADSCVPDCLACFWPWEFRHAEQDPQTLDSCLGISWQQRILALPNLPQIRHCGSGRLTWKHVGWNASARL